MSVGIRQPAGHGSLALSQYLPDGKLMSHPETASVADHPFFRFH